ncbi:hypothetical protein NEF87_000609 [Candidatus Lokiarchaeum ossiferum]|uniref:Uncharacterized protein n=1 Tax=Candidatus Lokiarchaeum ossiferum TaxID=2951803 RepID=A0ABY6HPD1_9ARCH|nr:hypothetical protein NEF87_000609 [Candidatus Lokiarchaeum sp. B-35]
MPLGIEIMHWDERLGAEVYCTYPDTLDIQEKTLMQLYSQHEFTGDSGMVSIMTGSTNIASYYTGPETAIYIILVLKIEEDGDTFEEGLVEISRQIMSNLDTETLRSILPPLFQRLSVYPSLNPEQKLALIYSSEVKRMILKRMHEEIILTKSELAIWLKDQHKDMFVDLDNIITSLIKANLVKSSSVKGISSDVLFLAKDTMMIRKPPANLFKDPVDHHLPESLKAAYQGEVRGFFRNYKPSEDDNLLMIDRIILNPQIYEVLKLLREAFVTKNDIEKLRKKGVDDVDGVLRDLWQTKMMGVFKDAQETEYYGLVSDFYIGTYYPRHALNTIRHQYSHNVQNPNALLKAIEIMREEYRAIEKAKKKKEKKSEEIVI